MKEEISALPRHVVYRPADVPAMGAQKLGAAKAFPRTEVSDLTKAIDWALAENTRQGSPYFGRIDPKQVAVSGFSCGGLQAVPVANDPRVKTLIKSPGPQDFDPALLVAVIAAMSARREAVMQVT